MQTVRAILILLWTTSTESFFEVLKGLPRQTYYKTSNKTALTREECLNKFCKFYVCAVAFSKEKKNCHKVLLSPMIIFWNPKAVLKPKADYETLVRTNVAHIVAPTILWLFDDVYHNLNFGSAGDALDMTIHGVNWKNTFHTTMGLDTRRPTHLRYAVANEKTVPKSLKLVHEGRRLVSFADGFTFALWINGGKRRAASTLLATANEEDQMFDVLSKPVLEILIRERGRQLELINSYRGNTILTRSVVTFQHVWFHLAFTFSKKDGRELFIHGHRLPLLVDEPGPIENADYLYFLGANSDHPYIGAFACVALFETPLEKFQIRNVMKSCP